jgi:hypothetical protein
MSIIFVLDNLVAGNAYIRGMLVVMGMKAKSIDAEYVVAKDFNPKTVNENDTVVFVKYDRLGQSSEVKKRGAKVVLDIVDSKKHWLAHRDNLDVLIVNTESSKSIIRNRFDFKKPIFKIPHILTNFSKDLTGQKRKSLPIKPRTLGYIGVSETFTDSKFFENFCNSNSLRWDQRGASVATNESSTMEIDLGCINFSHESDRIGGTYTMTKPSAKLLNLFSYGIPALFSPYESYIDAISSYNYHDLLWCVCGSKHAMIDKVKILIEDQELYKALSSMSYELSKNFHISNTVNIYKQLLDFTGS